MARQVKDYDDRYQEFLDVGQRLFYSKGYDQTSIQNIIDAVGVAKGLFYYYFRAKGDLLDAILERSLAQQLGLLTPLVEDPTLDASTKFVRLFADLGNWKLANRELFLEIMRVILRDENIVLRTKMFAMGVQAIVPLLAQVIRQGVDEGAFDVENVEDTAPIVIEMGQSLQGATSYLIMDAQDDPEALAVVMRKIDAYEQSIERVLGAQRGTLAVVPREQIRLWLV